MGFLAGPRLSRISLYLLLASLLPTSQAASLFSRADEVCGGNADLQQCGGDLPSSFCCGKDTTCTTVNSTIQAVICCPKGKDCSTIQTVPCDTTQYNATLHPDNQIHFADTKDVELPKCGDSCCPLGYTCNAGMCISVKQMPSTTTATPTPSSTPTTPASVSQTSDPAEPLPQANSSFDAKSFAAGFFPGLLLGALGVILFTWIVNRRRTKKATRYSGDFGHVARTISDPIYDPQQHARTDFIRHPSLTSSTPPSLRKNTAASGNSGAIGTRAAGGAITGFTPRIRSMWDRTPKLGIGIWSGLPASPTSEIQPPPPVVRAGDQTRDPYRTPGQTLDTERTRSRRKRRTKRPGEGENHERTRSRSAETIDVLMPAPSFLEPPRAPGMRENRMTADSGHTTFTKLMERAGYGEDSRESVRNYSGTPARSR